MKPIPILVVSCLCLAMTTSGADAGQLVVVESNAPEIKTGTVIEDAEPIHLDADAKLTLMKASVEMVRLAGPFDGPPTSGEAAAEAPQSGLISAVSALMRPEEATEVAGAFRSGPGAAASPPEIWLFDPAAGGTHCLPEATPGKLWRPDASTAATLEIWADEGDALVWWEEGEEVVDWPGELALTDGALYELNWEDSLDSAEVSLRLLPAATPPDASGLTTLIDNGCQRQALAVLARLAAAGDTE